MQLYSFFKKFTSNLKIKCIFKLKFEVFLEHKMTFFIVYSNNSLYLDYDYLQVSKTLSLLNTFLLLEAASKFFLFLYIKN